MNKILQAIKNKRIDQLDRESLLILIEMYELTIGKSIFASIEENLPNLQTPVAKEIGLMKLTSISNSLSLKKYIEKFATKGFSVYKYKTHISIFIQIPNLSHEEILIICNTHTPEWESLEIVLKHEKSKKILKTEDDKKMEKICKFYDIYKIIQIRFNFSPKIPSNLENLLEKRKK